jgi:hypothetical protein
MKFETTEDDPVRFDTNDTGAKMAWSNFENKVSLGKSDNADNLLPTINKKIIAKNVISLKEVNLRKLLMVISQKGDAPNIHIIMIY